MIRGLSKIRKCGNTNPRHAILDHHVGKFQHELIVSNPASPRVRRWIAKCQLTEVAGEVRSHSHYEQRKPDTHTWRERSVDVALHMTGGPACQERRSPRTSAPELRRIHCWNRLGEMNTLLKFILGEWIHCWNQLGEMNSSLNLSWRDEFIVEFILGEMNSLFWLWSGTRTMSNAQVRLPWNATIRAFDFRNLKTCVLKTLQSTFPHFRAAYHNCVHRW